MILESSLSVRLFASGARALWIDLKLRCSENVSLFSFSPAKIQMYWRALPAPGSRRGSRAVLVVNGAFPSLA